MKKWLSILAVLSVPFWMARCSTEPDPTPNPFTTDNGVVVAPDTVDPTTLVGLHKYLFAVKCANPTCHDGSFEPDFRTAESTYQTLVYHPVTKNTSDERFDFRILPNNHEMSWLYERLITTDDVIGRMPLYAPALSEKELGWVRAWINSGAPDPNGNPSVYPNQLPQIVGFGIFDASFQQFTTRLNGGVSPLVLPANENVTLYVQVEDDSTAFADLQLNQAKFAYDEYDFSQAIVKQAVPFSNIAYGASFNTNEFTPGDTVYFRYYVRDDDDPITVEFPNDESPFYFRIIASFVVQ